MKKHVSLMVMVSLLSLIFLIFAAGCGAKNSSSADTSSERGSISLKINWQNSKDIPATVSKITIDVYSSEGSGKLMPTTELTRNAGESTVSTTINGIPAGAVILQINAYNSNNTLLAYASHNVTIVEGKNDSVSITLTSRYDTVVTLVPQHEYEEYNNTITKKVHSGISSRNTISAPRTITTPQNNTYNLDFEDDPQIVTITQTYYIGHSDDNKPQHTISGPVTINFAQSSNYENDISSSISSSPYGNYLFNVSNTNVTVNYPMSDYPALAVIPPGTGLTPFVSYFSSTYYLQTNQCITVNWSSAGSDYVYFVVAEHTTTSDKTADIWWSSHDMRTLNTNDPDTFTAFINNLSTATTAIIPKNIFQDGEIVYISVFALNKTYANIDKSGNIAAYFIPFSQYRVKTIYSGQ